MVPVKEAKAIIKQQQRKRHFVEDEELINLSNGDVVAVCSQWGLGNIGRLILKAEELGYSIEKTRF